MSKQHYLYLLDGHTPVPTDDAVTWARTFATEDRTVACERRVLNQAVDVVTSFVGIDRAFHLPDQPPLLFETTIFGGPLDRYARQYATWEDAEKGHAEMLAMVMSGLRKHVRDFLMKVVEGDKNA